MKIKIMEIDMSKFSNRSGKVRVKEYHETRKGLKKNKNWDHWMHLNAPKTITEKEVKEVKG